MSSKPARPSVSAPTEPAAGPATGADPSPTEPVVAAADVEMEAGDAGDNTETGDAPELDATADAAANAAATNAAATATPPTASAISAATIAITDPKFGKFLAELDFEKFNTWLGHADNAVHLKSSNNLHWWSNQQDTLTFIHTIWVQYGCPGKGKGPWDGLGAMVKTKVRRDITNERCLTASKRIESAREVAEHLRNLFSTTEWLSKHADMKINEIVSMYIDKDETDPAFPRFQWPSVEPKYSTFTDISKKYCFCMRGGGRAGGRRFCCFCEPCCLALVFSSGSGTWLSAALSLPPLTPRCSRSHELQDGEGMTPLLDIPNCESRHVTCFKGSEETITCTAARGLANAKTRVKALWAELKRILKAGKYAAVQARVLHPTEKQVHVRPGHFWACEFGDANGKGSPIIHTFTKKNEVFTLSNGRKMVGDEGNCLLLVRRYFYRTVDDDLGLTFKQEPTKKGTCCPRLCHLA